MVAFLCACPLYFGFLAPLYASCMLLYTLLLGSININDLCLSKKKKSANDQKLDFQSYHSKNLELHEELAEFLTLDIFQFDRWADKMI